MLTIVSLFGTALIFQNCGNAEPGMKSSASQGVSTLKIECTPTNSCIPMQYVSTFDYTFDDYGTIVVLAPALPQAGITHTYNWQDCASPARNGTSSSQSEYSADCPPGDSTLIITEQGTGRSLTVKLHLENGADIRYRP